MAYPATFLGSGDKPSTLGEALSCGVGRTIWSLLDFHEHRPPCALVDLQHLTKRCLGRPASWPD